MPMYHWSFVSRDRWLNWSKDQSFPFINSANKHAFQREAGKTTLYGFSPKGEVFPLNPYTKYNGGSDGTCKVAALIPSSLVAANSTLVLTVQSPCLPEIKPKYTSYPLHHCQSFSGSIGNSIWLEFKRFESWSHAHFPPSTSTLQVKLPFNYQVSNHPLAWSFLR